MDIPSRGNIFSQKARNPKKKTPTSDTGLKFFLNNMATDNTEKFYSAMGAALSIEDQKFAALLNHFAQAALDADPRAFVQTIDSAIFGLEENQVRIAAEAGISFFESGFSLDEAAEKTKGLASSSFASLPDADPLKEASFHERVMEIVKVFSPLGRINRIQQVMLHDERIYSSSTILPQVRPVFKDDSESEIETLVAVFNWRVRYLVANKSREIHISLDLNDVNNLIHSLELAREHCEMVKESILKGRAKIVTSQNE